MSTCFWVGGTATWDTTNTGGGGSGGIKWANASGGTTTAAGSGTGGSPGAGDTATFDGSSGGGTVTVNFGGLITLAVLDMSAFTGTLDFATNNNSITLTANGNAFFSTGAAVRTLNMGSGTWTLSGANGTWNSNVGTNFTLNAGTSTVAFTGSGTRALLLGTKTLNAVTVAAGSASSAFKLNNSAGSMASLTIAAPNTVMFGQGFTYTITNLSVTGSSSSALTLFTSANPDGGTATISSANNFAGTWCGFQSVAWSGAGTFSATNSFGFTANTNITITPPSAGGGVVGVIGS